ncbi:DUF2207 domain-containing protein [Candidatus Kaiserbacteria bacterium]|nr:DUF2207 domain-containing protein [Candidatus Kaiserbacteria bacterium]
MRFLRIALLPVALAALLPFAVYAESIRSFDTQLTVMPTGVVHVVESIRYDFGTEEKHGIYRDIPTDFLAEGAEKRTLGISDISVTDASGSGYRTDVTRNSGTVHIRIGSPDTLVSGEKLYVITYDAVGAIIPLKDGDELYWNATGNDWSVPIDAATARITVPSGSIISASCYQGGLRSTETCASGFSGVDAHFTSGRGFAQKEGMTVAAAFPKGTVPILTPSLAQTMTVDGISKGIENGLLAPGRGVIGIAILLFSFIPSGVYPWAGLIVALAGIYISFRTWWLHGKDPKGKGTIIPYYEPPENVSPIEGALLVRQKITGRDITAQLISIAIQGGLKISQETSKTFGIFKSTDYRLIETGGQKILADEHDRDIYEALFYAATTDAGVRSILLSDIDKQHFQSQLQTVKKTVQDSVVTKGLYDGTSKKYQMILGLSAGFVLFVAFLGFMMSADVATDHAAVGMLVLGFAVAAVAAGFASLFMSRVTPDGALRREELLGLKDYLQIAEKNRLEFHNAPDKRPEVFEALLPYAVMFGVEKAWAKEFEGVYVQPPSWYSGANMTAFSATSFTHDLHGFSGSFTSSISVSASGSGGGGFSGGGGGGGGGGSW